MRRPGGLQPLKDGPQSFARMLTRTALVPASQIRKPVCTLQRLQLPRLSPLLPQKWMQEMDLESCVA